jgi:gliding motility-associated-like protein
MHKYFYTLLFLLFASRGMGQLCGGSLGDPIVNITFGAGPNPGAPLSAAATGYQYLPVDCPNDGFYTVTNSTLNCFSSSWHNVIQDHTGNNNGYFMLVNASVQPSAFYIDTVRGLCSNMTFEFASWIMNVLSSNACGSNASQPNITFNIEKTDGTIIQSYNSGNVPVTSSPVWKQFGFFFRTPAGVSDIVLRMVNNAPGGCGNDLAVDDITFRPCGPQLLPTVTGEAVNDIQICKGTDRSFSFNCSVSGGFTNPVFQWQQQYNESGWTNIPGATQASYMANFPVNTAAGTYQFRLTVAEDGNQNSAQCTISSIPITVIVNENPVATVTNSGPVCSGSKLTLTATGGSVYEWAGPSGFSARGAVVNIDNLQSQQAGNYQALVISAAGCSTLANTTVTLSPSPVAMASVADTFICMKDSVALEVNGGIKYAWSPSTGLSSDTINNPIASPIQTTSYQVIVSNGFNCKDTAFVKVTVYKKAIANAGPDKFTAPNIPVQLSGSIEENYSQLIWSPAFYINNTRILTPQVSPPADASYVLTAISPNGCGTSSDTVMVKVSKQLFIPNAFTPNGDAINDTWNIPALNSYSNFSLGVFNRYGEMVFQKRYPFTPWNGMHKGVPLAAGVYAYYIAIEGEPQTFKGTVTIIR